MSAFNFLSGSSIDNITKNLYDCLDSGRCYLGMARGEVGDLNPVPNVQWGVNALVYVEFKNSNLLSVVATGGTDGASASKFYDISAMRSSGGLGNQTVSIYKVASTGVSASTPVSGLSGLKCNYLGKNWMLIEGLPRDYYNFMSHSATANYWITNWNNNWNIAAKILPKSFVNVPFYATECSLWSIALSANISTGLQKIQNILGESYITGLHDPNSAEHPLLFGDSASGKEFMMDDTFQIRDLGGSILVDGMKMIDPDGSAKQIYYDVVSPEGDLGNTSKHLGFQYLYTGGEAQTIKVIVGNRQVNELGVWNEKQPYESVLPVCDANPPGLEISYLKNPLFGNSIFDVKGMVRLTSSDVWFIRELVSTNEVSLYTGPASAGNYEFTKEEIVLTGEAVIHSGAVSADTPAGIGPIPLESYHTFVQNDIVTFANIIGSYEVCAVTYGTAAAITLKTVVPVPIPRATEITSAPTTAIARITIAKTQDKRKALQYGFTAAMVTKNVPLPNDASGNPVSGAGISACPTDDIYRQLFIAYQPKDASSALCSLDVYKTPTLWTNDLLFNKSTREWDLGTVLYTSSKIPIYRKYAKSSTGYEEFKIIL